MLKYILIFISCTTICFGQVKGEKELQECELLLKDSTSFSGFCKVMKNDKIKFSMERDSTPDIWDATHVKSVRFFRSENDQVLEYFYLRKGKKPRLLEVVIHGDVVLYAYKNSRIVKDKIIGYTTTNTPIWSYTREEVVMSYYIKRSTSSELMRIHLSWSNRNWKKKMLAFFKDCPLLVEDIEADAYDKKSILQLVEDYNIYCVD